MTFEAERNQVQNCSSSGSGDDVSEPWSPLGHISITSQSYFTPLKSPACMLMETERKTSYIICNKWVGGVTVGCTSRSLGLCLLWFLHNSYSLPFLVSLPSLLLHASPVLQDQALLENMSTQLSTSKLHIFVVLSLGQT